MVERNNLGWMCLLNYSRAVWSAMHFTEYQHRIEAHVALLFKFNRLRECNHGGCADHGFKLVVASMSVCAAIARLNHFARAGLDRYGKFFGQRCRPNASGDASVIVTCVERCC